MKNILAASFCCLVFSTCTVPTLFAQDAWGHLKGMVQATGELPEIDREEINKDVESCLVGKVAPLDDNLVVGKDGGLRDVFVMMYLKDEEVPIHPSYEETKDKPVVLDNKNCRFKPHAIFLRVGQPLHLKNSDKVGHNCHGKFFNNGFNVNVPQDDVVKLKLSDKEKVPGLIVCDFHPWMDSVALVREEPYVAITNEKGEFEIKNIPAGKWKFQFWHRKGGYLRKLEIPGHKVGRRGEIEIDIESDKTLDLGKMTIDGKALNK